MRRSAAGFPLLALLLAGSPAAGQVDRPIPEWVVLGTYAVTDGPERVSRSYLPGEEAAAPRPGDESDGRTWMRAATETANLGRLDLLGVLAGISPVANAASYAFTWIASPDDRTVTLASSPTTTFASGSTARWWWITRWPAASRAAPTPPPSGWPRGRTASS